MASTERLHDMLDPWIADMGQRNAVVMAVVGLLPSGEYIMKTHAFDLRGMEMLEDCMTDILRQVTLLRMELRRRTSP